MGGKTPRAVTTGRMIAPHQLRKAALHASALFRNNGQFRATPNFRRFWARCRSPCVNFRFLRPRIAVRRVLGSKVGGNFARIVSLYPA